MHTHDQDLPVTDAPIVAPDRDGGVAEVLHALPGIPPAALRARSVLGLQRAVGNAAVSAMLEDDQERSPVHDVVGRGGGAPLDLETRSFMESRMGHDFSDVRVHTDPAATASAQAVGAAAYTVGNDVVVQAAHYAPGTDQGNRLLAHELTHVVQQNAGPVEGTPTAGGIAVSDPSDRFEQEAERSAESVMAVQRMDEEDVEEEEELPG